jgi:spore coat polysaccharide biosynthesis predicted glycosyltransferase SpsG
VIGYGHLFRCIALAEMLKSDFSITFIEKTSNKFACSQFEKISNKVIHIVGQTLEEELLEVSNHIINSSTIVIVDGYQYTSNYQKELKKTGATLVCIDDFHALHFYADVVINQAAGVSVNEYSSENETQFCLGFDWIIQRPSFIESSLKKRIITSIEIVFFTLGSGEVYNIAPKILSVLETFADIKRIVFLKGNDDVFIKDVNPNIKNSKKRIEIYEGLNDKELCTLLERCDIAICPASVISLEACSVGIGLFAGFTADNQYDNYKGLIANNVAFELGDLTMISEENLKQKIEDTLNITAINDQIEQQKRIFDGQSKNRYLNLFKSL